MEPIKPQRPKTTGEEATAYAKHLAKQASETVASGISKTAAIVGDLAQVPSRGRAAFGYSLGTFYEGETRSWMHGRVIAGELTVPR